MRQKGKTLHCHIFKS